MRPCYNILRHMTRYDITDQKCMHLNEVYEIQIFMFKGLSSLVVVLLLSIMRSALTDISNTLVQLTLWLIVCSSIFHSHDSL